MAENCSFELDSKLGLFIDTLCATAKKGLSACYYRKYRQGNGSNNHNSGFTMIDNLRYITIAQIGIQRWLRFHNDRQDLLPDLWEQIISRMSQIHTAGDLGLAVWAGVESGAPDCMFFAKDLADYWPKLRDACNAVELAWVVQGLVRYSQSQPMNRQLTNVLKDAHKRLLDLYCPDTALFARHRRKGWHNVISRHVACFADQVYPILALANYSRCFSDRHSARAAAAVADTICRLQGPKGQWWWHYDVKTGRVCEEYPVFSVHQDAMGPMALLAIDGAAGTNHSRYIRKGLMWLNKENELGQTMMLPEKGISWRDIHRRELGRMYRLVRAVLTAARWDAAHRLAGRNLFGYVVNKECRTYHLGWILYAWANVKQGREALMR